MKTDHVRRRLSLTCLMITRFCAERCLCGVQEKMESDSYPDITRIACLQHVKRKFIACGKEDKVTKGLADDLHLIGYLSMLKRVKYRNKTIPTTKVSGLAVSPCWLGKFVYFYLSPVFSFQFYRKNHLA